MMRLGRDGRVSAGGVESYALFYFYFIDAKGGKQQQA